jgi:hypothetical protein
MRPALQSRAFAFSDRPNSAHERSHKRDRAMAKWDRCDVPSELTVLAVKEILKSGLHPEKQSWERIT